MKRFLECGKDTLQRTEPPLVGVSRKETFPGITALFCRAYGFYPPEISMIWMRNGEAILQEMDYGDILPSGDGTRQTCVSESGAVPLLMKAVLGSVVLVIALLESAS